VGAEFFRADRRTDMPKPTGTIVFTYQLKNTMRPCGLDSAARYNGLFGFYTLYDKYLCADVSEICATSFFRVTGFVSGESDREEEVCRLCMKGAMILVKVLPPLPNLVTLKEDAACLSKGRNKVIILRVNGTEKTTI
jgi:hypothetical protein